jgi:hypothetical protein
MEVRKLAEMTGWANEFTFMPTTSIRKDYGDVACVVTSVAGRLGYSCTLRRTYTTKSV